MGPCVTFGTMTIENSMIDWDSKLLEALWAYCIAYKVTIWFTPLQLIYPREAALLVGLEHSIQWSIWMKWVVILLWKKIRSKMMCMSVITTGSKNVKRGVIHDGLRTHLLKTHKTFSFAVRNVSKLKEVAMVNTICLHLTRIVSCFYVLQMFCGILVDSHVTYQFLEL